MDNRAFNMMESWLFKNNRNNDGDDTCLIHAHLLYLFKNITYEELDFRAVSTMLSR